MTLTDIAWALSMKVRFTGHVRQLYTVGQHCVLVSEALERRGLLEGWKRSKIMRVATWGLLHDASEAYLPDIASPIKGMVYIGENDGEGGPFVTFRAAEDRLLRVIAERFKLEWPMPPEVKEADAELFRVERRHLLPPAGWWDCIDSDPTDWSPAPSVLDAWGPASTRNAYMQRAMYLGVAL